MASSSSLTSKIDNWIQILIKQDVTLCHSGFCLSKDEVLELVSRVQDVLSNEPMLLPLVAPIKVVGDIHGQFSDLLKIFKEAGDPSCTNYLFLGDYVDRGRQSLECICLLYCYRLRYPDTFLLLRGNHESPSVNTNYGFMEECQRRLNKVVWKKFNFSFQFLPVAGLIENRILCMHGGISPDMKSPEDINNIKRPVEIKDAGLLVDLMWSDPNPEETQYYAKNLERGIGQWFGKTAVDEFLDRNDLDMICRAHQCVEDGYEFRFNMRLLTIFSAPNYCGDFDNSGGILQVGEDLSCNVLVLRPLSRQLRRYPHGVKKTEPMIYLNTNLEDSPENKPNISNSRKSQTSKN